MNRSKIIKIAIVLLFVFMFNCSDLDHATQVIEDANKKASDAGHLYIETESRAKDILNFKGRTVEEARAFKAKVLDDARSIAADYQKVSDMLKEVAAQYDAVSKMNVNSEHQEFAKARSQEYSKRSEAVAVIKDGVQAFIDMDDFDAIHTKIADCLEKQHELLKEASDLESKATMIRHRSNPFIKWE